MRVLFCCAVSSENDREPCATRNSGTIPSTCSRTHTGARALTYTHARSYACASSHTARSLTHSLSHSRTHTHFLLHTNQNDHRRSVTTQTVLFFYIRICVHRIIVIYTHTHRRVWRRRFRRGVIVASALSLQWLSSLYIVAVVDVVVAVVVFPCGPTVTAAVYHHQQRRALTRTHARDYRDDRSMSFFFSSSFKVECALLFPKLA